MVFRKFEFRIYPNKKQALRLDHQLEPGTEIYNQLLTICKEEFLENEIKLGRYDLEYYLTLFRKNNQQYRAMYRFTLMQIAKRLSQNLNEFFKRTSEWKKGNGDKPGPPRYKKKIRSIDFDSLSVKILDNRTVKIGRIGTVEAVIHRKIEGEVKGTTVIKKASGKWYIIFTCELEVEVVMMADKGDVGIDVGVTRFATLSDGTVIDNPRFLLKSEKRIKRLQKDLSRKQKGSNNWKRSKLLVAIAYERVENQRNDFLHKLSRQFVNDYGLIAVESLGIEEMLADRKMAKSISDVSWYKFIRMLEYKASSAGS